MNSKRFWLSFPVLFWAASCLWAGDGFPLLQTAPWNGCKAATSLTFDDSDPSHLDVAIPELNRRKMRATFFLIANRTDRKDEWRQMLAAGHEIGNHTLDHPHLPTLTPREQDSQITGAHHVLQKEFGVSVDSFAYPYGELTPDLEKLVAQSHSLARGVAGVSPILPDSNPDWMNIPSRGTMSDFPFSTYQQWINEDLKAGGWLVWMIHGLEGTPWGYQPLSKKIFEEILDDLQSKDIWVGTFLEVGSYFHARNIFEKSAVVVHPFEKKLSWAVPDHFPLKVVLKIRMDDEKVKKAGVFEIWQGSQKLSPDEKGFYPVAFDAKELTIRLLPKS